MKGRKAKPAAIRELEGNPGHRLIPTQPVLRPMRTDSPEDVKGKAAEFWRELAPDLVRRGIATELDEMAFFALCHVLEDYFYTPDPSRRSTRRLLAEEYDAHVDHSVGPGTIARAHNGSDRWSSFRVDRAMPPRPLGEKSSTPRGAGWFAADSSATSCWRILFTNK